MHRQRSMNICTCSKQPRNTAEKKARYWMQQAPSVWFKMDVEGSVVDDTKNDCITFWMLENSTGKSINYRENFSRVFLRQPWRRGVCSDPVYCDSGFFSVNYSNFQLGIKSALASSLLFQTLLCTHLDRCKKCCTLKPSEACGCSEDYSAFSTFASFSEFLFLYLIKCPNKIKFLWRKMSFYLLLWSRVQTGPTHISVAIM